MLWLFTVSQFRPPEDADEAERKNEKAGAGILGGSGTIRWITPGKGTLNMSKKQATPETKDESILVHAAKTIGAAAGKIAKLAGVEPEPRGPAQSQKVPKLAKKEKHRLPRREKKALQKRS
jgi:hypothetical protein